MNDLNNLDFTKIKNVILRVDFNVPIDQNFIIQDFTRINRSRETIEKLHKNIKIKNKTNKKLGGLFH